MDYSDWLAQDWKRLEEQVFGWGKPVHQRERTIMGLMVRKVCETHCHGEGTLLDVGCGEGWVGDFVPQGFVYMGLDDNLGCLRLVRERGYYALQMNIRSLAQLPQVDVVTCFSTLKHFSTGEFSTIFRLVVQQAQFAVFNMQFAPEEFDAGTDYPDLWITQDRLNEELRSSRIYVLHAERMWEGEEEKEKGRTVITFATRRIGKGDIPCP